MKRQIHADRGHDEIAVEGHNVKLGRGGIREIEFFVQTQQLIVGGRNAHLRLRQTLPALAALAEDGWIAPAARDELTRPTTSCARSSTGCRWWPTSRPSRCRRTTAALDALRPLLRARRPRRLRRGHPAAFAHRAAPLCRAVRGRPAGGPDRGRLPLPRRPRRQGDPRHPEGPRLQGPARRQLHRARMAGRPAARAAQRDRARAAHRAGAGAARRLRLERQRRRRAHHLRPLPRRAQRRGRACSRCCAAIPIWCASSPW